MAAKTYTVELDGGTLQRGFWIYVWEVTTPADEKLLYVGRTGDSSSPNAQSPFNRMGQHLGDLENSSMLRNHLMGRAHDPEQCSYRMVAHGPILDEAADWPNTAEVAMQLVRSRSSSLMTWTPPGTSS